MILKNNKRLIQCFLIVSIIICGCMSIYAIKEVSVINNLSTDEVKISLENYTIENGRETEFIQTNENSLILPGQTVSRIFRISNKSASCYIRSSIDFDTENIIEDAEFDIGDKWIRAKDGYYYYTDILKEDDKVDLFSKITFPKDMNQELSEKEINLSVTVDAIQSQNFYPDFSVGNPWGNVEIQDNTSSKVRVCRKKSDNTFRLEYDKNVQKLIVNADDFFFDFPTMMPGDTVTHDLVIRNTESKKRTIYMKSEVLDDEKKMFDHIQMKIELIKDGKTTLIYEGKVNNEELKKKFSLGKFGNGILRYTISVPAEFDNEYILSDCQVKWTFSTDDPAKTGDSSNIIVPAIALGLSAMLIAVLLKKRKKESDDDDNSHQ